MICKDFHKIIKNENEDVEEAIFEYGYSCGVTQILDFNKISNTMKALNVPEMEATKYTRKIISGFCNGLRHKFIISE